MLLTTVVQYRRSLTYICTFWVVMFVRVRGCAFFVTFFLYECRGILRVLPGIARRRRALRAMLMMRAYANQTIRETLFFSLLVAPVSLRLAAGGRLDARGAFVRTVLATGSIDRGLIYPISNLGGFRGANLFQGSAALGAEIRLMLTWCWCWCWCWRWCWCRPRESGHSASERALTSRRVGKAHRFRSREGGAEKGFRHSLALGTIRPPLGFLVTP